MADAVALVEAAHLLEHRSAHEHARAAEDVDERREAHRPAEEHPDAGDVLRPRASLRAVPSIVSNAQLTASAPASSAAVTSADT